MQSLTAEANAEGEDTSAKVSSESMRVMLMPAKTNGQKQKCDSMIASERRSSELINKVLGTRSEQLIITRCHPPFPPPSAKNMLCGLQDMGVTSSAGNPYIK
jgi:hypothetical protein